MNKIIIAIDGHSSTGKSTLAKQLAKALNYIYIDTGAMYRAVTYYALQNGLIGSNHFDKNQLIKDLDKIHINFVYNPGLGYAEVHLNGENIESEIRKMEVSNFVSQIATVPEIREKLVAQQREIGKNKGIVMDGRDIGSVVFPAAELKIFMTASPEVRARRRYDELMEKGQTVTYDEVLQNVISRDKTDSTRSASPLIKTTDAIEIDNSNLSREQQLEKVIQLAKEKINLKKQQTKN
jgi:cytidylate kinase